MTNDIIVIISGLIARLNLEGGKQSEKRIGRLNYFTTTARMEPAR